MFGAISGATGASRGVRFVHNDKIRRVGEESLQLPLGFYEIDTCNQIWVVGVDRFQYRTCR